MLDFPPPTDDASRCTAKKMGGVRGGLKVLKKIDGFIRIGGIDKGYGQISWAISKGTEFAVDARYDFGGIAVEADCRAECHKGPI